MGIELHCVTILFLFLCADGGQWKKSEEVNSTQGFYFLSGLEQGTQYHLEILHGNYTHWKEQIWTKGPGMSIVSTRFGFYLHVLVNGKL